MNQERLLQVILAPHVTEKSTLLEDHNQHVFKVCVNATKREIKHAIELLYKVKVLRVSTVNMKRIQKKTNGRIGYLKAWKKAYVTLHADQELDSYLVDK